jgi:hypothetical protein
MICFSRSFASPPLRPPRRSTAHLGLPPLTRGGGGVPLHRISAPRTLELFGRLLALGCGGRSLGRKSGCSGTSGGWGSSPGGS